MVMIRRIGFAQGAAAPVLGAGVVLAALLVPCHAAAPVQMPHAADLSGYWETVEAGACLSCHSLKDRETDPNTAYIALPARTLNTIKSISGGTTPENLGCIFCHNRQVEATRMIGVLGHFHARRSQHPVGRTFTGPTPYLDTDNKFISSYGSNTPNEMDCIDCHDAELVAPGGRYYAHLIDKELNPFMLKGVTAPGQYDDFCRSCHGALAPAAFKGKDIRVSSHRDGRDVANALAEIDGTLLLTSDPDKDGTPDRLTGQCTICHAAHSSGYAKLFADAFANGTDCTTVCHLRGDRFDNYDRGGHGKATSTYADGGSLKPLAFPCTRCHVALDVSTPNAQLSPPRKKHVETPPLTGDRAGYKAAFNLSVDLMLSDGGTATGNPAYGVCASCHSRTRYKAHTGYEGRQIGCQDCHDEHGENTGAGNIFMIPTLSKEAGFFTSPLRSPGGVEAVTYLNPRFQQGRDAPTGGPYDFYRTDGEGICDNTECHGTAFAGSPGRGFVTPGPLESFLDSGNHSGGELRPADDLDCGACHAHGDVQGGWGARKTCEVCHISQGRTHANATESVATHAKHLAASRVYVAGCEACHAHNGKTVPPDTDLHGDGTVDFGGSFMDDSFTYTESFDDSGCSTTACHDAPPAGAWRNGLGPDACRACHLADTDKSLGAGSRPTLGVHAATGGGTSPGVPHNERFPDDQTEEMPGTAVCVTCHTKTPSSSHLDGSLQAHVPEITVAPAVGFVAAPTPTCAPSGALADCHSINGD